MLSKSLKEIVYLGLVVGFLVNSEGVKCEEAEVKPQVNTPPECVEVTNVPHLEQLLKNSDYSLESILAAERDIPRTYFANFPADLRKVKGLEQKKQLFIHTLLPMILHVNEVILQERKHLLSIKKALGEGKRLKHHEEHFLTKISEKYQVNSQDIDLLLRRVDIIPPSLALGQAIIESGWGLSYAALKKNSPFGVTPRPLKVKAYNSLYDSVAGYMLNLNRNTAYRKMRETREQIRKENKDPDGSTLIGDMLAYSEQRNTYIAKVRTAIKQNELNKYDSLSLEPTSKSTLDPTVEANKGTA